MPEEWKTSVVVPIFKRKGDVMDCGAYREVKLLEQWFLTFSLAGTPFASPTNSRAPIKNWKILMKTKKKSSRP